eukprot:Gb_03163 [translate_table: standard]
MVHDLPIILVEKCLCEACVMGKQHREKFFKEKAWRVKNKLELVHMDLCGPMQTQSLGGAKWAKCALTFIDNFSKQTWVYLKYKSEVFNNFVDFKAFVEKQSGHQIQRLRTDNGGEYVINDFHDFCTTHGIQMQRTVPYTPQQNGVAERKNLTLKEMANCMIHSRNFAPQFWAETIHCANYIQNRTPHSVVQGVTPKEAWSKRKPRVDHFRVFGSLAWVHIPDDAQMEKKSEPCIFVGYCEDVKAYRLLVLGTQEVIFRRNVQIEERSLAYVPSSSTSSPSSNLSSFDEDNELSNVQFQGGQLDEFLPPAEPPHPAPTTCPLPKWVQTIRKETGTSVGDPSDTRRTRSETQEAHLTYLATDSNPQTFKQVVNEWDEAMNAEYRSLLKNDTWDLVPLPKGRKIVRCKWVYRTKYATNGNVEKYKAPLVAKGFSQVEGVDYSETFAPVAKMNSIRLVLSLAVSHKWVVHQMDVKSAFLNDDLQEEIYMEQPLGFALSENSSLVCRLRKSLYGLKQAPWAWYEKMDKFLLDSGFSRCHSDPTVYTKKSNDELLILVLYVDDLIITGSSTSLIHNVKSSLMNQFEMTDLGLLHFFHGLQVNQLERDKYSQPKYALDLLRRFNMLDCSLLYLTHSRLDLSFAVGLVSRFMQNPHESHWQAAKYILRYI